MDTYTDITSKIFFFSTYFQQSFQPRKIPSLIVYEIHK